MVHMSLSNEPIAFRPPAVPLITHTPYFSVWSAADKLTDSETSHWTGSSQPLCGLIRVDGVTARFMGSRPRDLPGAKQISLTVTCTRTIYEFEFNGVGLEVEFLSPLLPDDLDLLTRPVTYLTLTARSIDGAEHEVEVYVDATAGLAVNTFDQKVYGARQRLNNLEVLTARSADQPVLAKKGDNLRIDWGTFYLAVANRFVSIQSIQDSKVSRNSFISTGKTLVADDTRFPRDVWDGSPCLSVSIPFGAVKAEDVSRYILLAYDEEYAIEYFGRKLVPYWKRNGQQVSELLESSDSGYSFVRQRCQQFDRATEAELADRGGEKFAKIAELSFRQCLSAHGIVEDFDGTLLMFSKENFSNGCIGTVDVTYPGSPFFLHFNPKLLRAQIEPILDYSATPRWKFPFAPHDLGTYPQANGQVYGGGEHSEDDQMPVEECGNMLILVAAVCKALDDKSLAEKHWTTLLKWAGYLMQSGLDPDNQLCTDDFAGHLAHNANLSIKAIVALGAFAQLCKMRGDETRAQIMQSAAQRMVDQWRSLAFDGDHYRLAFDRPGTWSQKYNLAWERILGLKLFPMDLIDTEIAYYLTRQNKFGLPLDNRAAYTKFDWVVWTATLSDSRKTFESFVDPLFHYLDESPSRVPLSDWHDTETAKQIGFQARSVVGGIFIPLVKTL